MMDAEKYTVPKSVQEQDAARAGECTKSPGRLQPSFDDPLNQRGCHIERLRKLASMFGRPTTTESQNWLELAADRLEQLEIEKQERPASVIERLRALAKALGEASELRSRLAGEVAESDFQRKLRSCAAKERDDVYGEIKRLRSRLAESEAGAQRNAAQWRDNQKTIDMLSVDIRDAKDALNRHHRSA